MVEIKLTNVEIGPGPNEQVVNIRTTDGVEQLITSGSQVVGNHIQAASIMKEGSRVLIQLPSESMSGRWRVWVDEGEIK